LGERYETMQVGHQIGAGQWRRPVDGWVLTTIKTLCAGGQRCAVVFPNGVGGKVGSRASLLEKKSVGKCGGEERKLHHGGEGATTTIICLAKQEGLFLGFTRSRR